VRLPGEFGPVLRCSGELSDATAEALRRELVMLEPLDHPVIIINLADCSYLDVDGILTVMESLKRRRAKGRRLVVVAGTGAVARLLHVVGLDWVVPVFPTEDVAALALRGGGPPVPAPSTWATARALTAGRWRVIQDAIDGGSAEEVLHLLTSMTALCDRSEELFQARSLPATSRCQFCPLFHALGGHPEDVGCRSIRDPIIESLRAGDRETARAEVAAVIRTIEQMPLRDECSPLVPEKLSN
jgi:anti-anti-sigma factor